MKPVLHIEIEDVAARMPDRVAVRAPDGEVTYGRLDAQADAVAACLRDDHDLRPGTVVALLLPPGGAYVTAMLAVLKAGGVFLPLDPSTPSRRRRAWIAKAKPALVITDEAGAALWAADGNGQPVLLLDRAAAGLASRPPLPVTGEEAGYIVFTSGTTGEPKAILGSQTGLSHFVHWEVTEFGLGSEDRVSQLAPLTFDVSLRDMLVPLLAGGTLCVPPTRTRHDIRALLDWLHDERITLIHCVPSLFRALTEEIAGRTLPAARLPALRRVLLAGEPLYGADVQRWRSAMGEGVELVNLYGPSETTLAKAFHRIAEVPEEPGRMIPVGQPLPNTALLVIRDGELCDRGEIGEVFIRTPFMSRGYLDAPELTQDAFVQNPLAPDRPDLIYRTGDLGRYRQDRSVELLGRRDNQVKINGIRIEVAEVEQALRQVPAIRDVVVAAHSGADRQVFLTAYVIADAPLADEALRAHLGDWLDAAMHPAFFVRMDAFPLTLHGKVNRRALPRPADLLYREKDYVAPTDETEAAVAAIWSEILDLPKVGVTHGFVELGGDSLKAIRVLARLAQQLGADVALPDVLPRGTVREIASLIAARRAPALPPSPAQGIAPPTAEELQWLES